MTSPRLEFGWSCSRHRLFQFCERAYFYHYYGAWKGWEPYAENGVRSAYALKNLVPADRWVLNVLTAALRETLREAPRRRRPLSIKDLNWKAYEKITRDGRDLLDERWRDDPKMTCLMESFYGYDSPKALIASCQERLFAALEAFTAAPVFAELAALPFFCLDDADRPWSFLLGDVKVWVAPRFSWSLDGQAHVLSFHLGGPEAEDHWSLPAAVNVLAMAAAKRVQPERVESRTVFLEASRAYSVYAYRNLTETRRTIAESATAIRARLTVEGAAFPENFPPSPSPEKCADCAFRAVCRNQT